MENGVRTRRNMLKYLFTFPMAGRPVVALIAVQFLQAAGVRVAVAQGNGGGNGNGNNGGNGGGNNGGGNGNGNGGNSGGNGSANGGGNGNGGSNDGGHGNGGGKGNGNESGSGSGKAPDPGAAGNSGQNRAGVQQSGQALEVRHANGITETLRKGRYSMRDNKGRVIVDRLATVKDRLRFQGSR